MTKDLILARLIGRTEGSIELALKYLDKPSKGFEEIEMRLAISLLKEHLKTVKNLEIQLKEETRSKLKL